MGNTQTRQNKAVNNEFQELVLAQQSGYTSDYSNANYHLNKASKYGYNADNIAAKRFNKGNSYSPYAQHFIPASAGAGFLGTSFLGTGVAGPLAATPFASGLGFGAPLGAAPFLNSATVTSPILNDTFAPTVFTLPLLDASTQELGQVGQLGGLGQFSQLGGLGGIQQMQLGLGQQFGQFGQFQTGQDVTTDGMTFVGQPTETVYEHWEPAGALGLDLSTLTSTGTYW